MISTFDGTEYRWLSNFYPCIVIYEGAMYPTTEHAYQAAKTLDLEWRDKIRRATTPSKAKALGRKVPMRDDWDDIKVDVMRDVLWQKFKQHRFQIRLVMTGDQELVEGNWWHDTFWGQCPLGVGQNMLGKLLMEVRGEIINDLMNTAP
jgi:ribA/ribD-fused uncharacterized protein